MRVSVVTAVYRNVTCLSDCIQSLASQTHPDIEHIIIDGGSNDGMLTCIIAPRRWRDYDDRHASSAVAVYG